MLFRVEVYGGWEFEIASKIKSWPTLKCCRSVCSLKVLKSHNRKPEGGCRMGNTSTDPMHREIQSRWCCQASGFKLCITLTISDPTSNLVRQNDFAVPLRCRKMSDRVVVAFVRPLSEPVRRFSSCSTDFSQQIAQAVLFLFLYVFLF
jgi:hypothetical protein